MNFVSILIGLAVPLARKVFVGLGISVVTYTGLSFILNQLQDYIVTSIGGATGAAAQISAILGFHQAVGILIAAITTKFAMAQLTQWVKS